MKGISQAFVFLIVVSTALLPGLVAHVVYAHGPGGSDDGRAIPIGPDRSSGGGWSDSPPPGPSRDTSAGGGSTSDSSGSNDSSEASTSSSTSSSQGSSASDGSANSAGTSGGHSSWWDGLGRGIARAFGLSHDRKESAPSQPGSAHSSAALPAVPGAAQLSGTSPDASVADGMQESAQSASMSSNSAGTQTRPFVRTLVVPPSLDSYSWGREKPSLLQAAQDRGGPTRTPSSKKAEYSLALAEDSHSVANSLTTLHAPQELIASAVTGVPLWPAVRGPGGFPISWLPFGSFIPVVALPNSSADTASDSGTSAQASDDQTKKQVAEAGTQSATARSNLVARGLGQATSHIVNGHAGAAPNAPLAPETGSAPGGHKPSRHPGGGAPVAGKGIRLPVKGLNPAPPHKHPGKGWWLVSRSRLGLVVYERVVILFFRKGQVEADGIMVPPAGERFVLVSESTSNRLPFGESVRVSCAERGPETLSGGLAYFGDIDPGSFIAVHGRRSSPSGSGTVLVYLDGYLTAVPRTAALP